MKLVQINTFPYKATGSIMMSIHNAATVAGIDSYVVWGRGRKPENDHEFSIEDDIEIKIHGLLTRLTDRTGFFSKKATRNLLGILDLINPDIVHLHNIHGYYVNIPMLFGYLESKKIKVVWTLHDCWTFTGHCAYYSMIGCEKWKDGCNHCPQKKTYPTSVLMDSSRWNWEQKRRYFTSVDPVLVPVSDWLAGEVRKSYFKNSLIRTIYNGISLEKYHPVESDIRTQLEMKNKFMILCLASEWTERKGYQDIIKLAGMLDDNSHIVMIGDLKEEIEEVEHLTILPRVNDLKDLLKLYTAADVVFNPSLEETFGMTSIEAHACGTPTIVYDVTALSEVMSEFPELIVEKHDLEAVLDIIQKLSVERVAPEKLREGCKKYREEIQIQEYLNLYEQIV